jgi:hypothetical protein
MPYRKRVMGLVSLSLGLGMILALIVPTWTGFVAIVLMGLGIWNLFFC